MTATSPTIEQISYVRDRIGEAIVARMILGETLEEATEVAFEICNDRWPTVTAILIDSYKDAAKILS